MATIVKRDGSEIHVDRQPVENQSLKKSSLLLIAQSDSATIIDWSETNLNKNSLLLKLECIIDLSKLRPTT